MAFQARPLAAGAPEPSGYLVPSSGVRARLAAAVALDADVPVRMAGLAGRQVPAGLHRMLAYCRSIFLTVRSEHLV